MSELQPPRKENIAQDNVAQDRSVSKEKIRSRNALGLAGKYLLFRLDSEQYGLPILQVREIISLEAITRVPLASECIRGVINLRGKVIPVMDLRTRFGLSRISETEENVIIVLQCDLREGPLTIGVVVDCVQEVVLLGPEQVAKPPDGTGVEEDFIIGIGSPKEGQILFLLDVEEVVRFDEEGARRAADLEAPNAETPNLITPNFKTTPTP